MSNACLKLLSAVSCLSLAILTMSKAEALTMIGPNQTIEVTSTQAVQYQYQGGSPPGGTLILDPGITNTGALTNLAASVGTLVLDSGSTENGQIGTGVSPLFQITLNGNATIIGQTSTSTFNLGQFTLNNTGGALALPTGVIINTSVVSNTLFGNIYAAGQNDGIAAPITINVDASGVTALTPGAPLFIILAGAGPSGIPVNVTTSGNALYTFTGSNLNGNITITPFINPGLALPGGTGSVLSGLLAIAAANPGSDIAAVAAALAALPTTAAVDEALLQLDPNVNGSIPMVSFNASKQFTNLWSKHMGYGRCVYATECIDEVCCHGKLVSHPRNPRAESDCCNEGCYTEINCENVCNSWEVWGDTFGYFGHQNDRDGFEGYNAKIFGGMVGFQAPLCQMTSAGLGIGYANSSIHGSGKGIIQTYDLTAYFSYDATHFYVDAAFSFDVNRYKDSREIDFPGIDRDAHAHFYGQEYSGLVAAGYRFYTSWCGVITPLASLLYSHLHVNSYHEHGAGDIDLHVKKQNYNFLESSLGLKLSQIIQTSSGAIVPEIHGLWLHDFFGDRMNLTSSFSGVAEGAGPFTTKGPSQDRNYGDVGAGITFITCSDLAFELVYNYEFGKTYHSQERLLKITQRF